MIQVHRQRQKSYTFTLIAIFLLTGCDQKEPPAEDGWIDLFNGEDLSGWTASENKESFWVEDGNIVANGERSHLFYTGDVEDADFSDFELRAEVMTFPLANSGIYFHTEYQEEGWPAKGYEAQVNSTHIGAGDYRELKKTGSLYAVRNTYKQLVPDNEWFDYHIKVIGDRIQIRINDCLVVDYLQSEPDSLGRIKYTGSGTFALQGHDPDSKVYFRNIRVKSLNEEEEDGLNPVVRNETYLKLRELMGQQHSFTDLGVDFDESFDLNQALDFYYRTGINLGIVLDSNELDQAERLSHHPVFIGVQSSTTEIDNDHIDYIIGTAGSYPEGKEGEIFMDAYVESIIADLSEGAVDVWSQSSNLPESMMGQYDQLWTQERKTQVIEAAIHNDVAIEIDNLTELPGTEFLKTAKELGAKFTYSNLGTGSDTGELDYIFQVIEECELGYKDIYIP